MDSVSADNMQFSLPQMPAKVMPDQAGLHGYDDRPEILLLTVLM